MINFNHQRIFSRIYRKTITELIQAEGNGMVKVVTGIVYVITI